ncbi:MAG: hypothetical protein ACRYFV_01580 [Janthinobacterium lividum]
MAKKPAALPIPAAPLVLQKVGREVRLKLPTGYLQGAMEVQQVTRGIPYEPLTAEFGGTHTDADGTVVVPGIGTDYVGEFRLRVAASAKNQAGQELIIPIAALSTTQPAPTPSPVVLPTPIAPTLVAVQNLDGRFQFPAGIRDITLIEIELS